MIGGLAASTEEFMRTYLVISQGPEPRAAVPVAATEDPEVIRAAAEALAFRLGILTPTALRRLVRDQETADRRDGADSPGTGSL